MGKYGLVIKLTIQDLFEYRLDFFFHVIKYAFMILMMTFVWLAVQKESGQQLLSEQQTISYFSFVAILYSLSNFHTHSIETDIKLGGLTKYLVKPINPFMYYFSREGAIALLETVVKAIVMIPILGLLGYLPHVTLLHIGVFVLFLPLAFTYAFHQFFIISSFAFWVNEIFAVRWTLMIVFRFLEGMLVPLAFMPLLAQRILFWTPYPHLVSTPIQLLQGTISFSTAFQGLGILCGWIVLLHGISYLQWQKGARSYEATGM